MALSVILRNNARLQGALMKNLPSTFLKNTQSTKNFSQILSNSNKNILALSLNKSKMQLFTKRNMSADHSKLWPIERAFSVALIGLVPLSIMTPGVVLDDLLAITSVMHFHWGLEACVIDYVRPILVGNVIPKLALGLLYVISVSTLGGLIYYNHNNIGIGKTVRKIWEIKPQA